MAVKLVHRLRVELCRCGIDPVTYMPGRCTMWRVTRLGKLLGTEPTMARAGDAARRWVKKWG